MRALRPRILCLAPNWLGDAVLALPALARLREAPVEVELLVRRGTTRVFVDAIGGGTIHEVERAARLQRFAHAWRLRRRRFDAAVVLPPSWSSAALAWMSGARQRFGERGAGRGVWLTQALVPAGRDTHLALGYQRIVDAALEGLDVVAPAATGGAAHLQNPAQPAAPPGLHAPAALRVHTDEVDAAVALLRGSGSVESRPLVLAPGARYGPAKRYPVERFAVVGAEIGARLDASWVLVGGVADAPVTAALCERLPGSVDLAGRTPLGTLLGVLSQARGVLSNDSGVMHLAAALGTPVLGIFGSTNPVWTRPVGPRAGWVSHAVPCAPCYRRTCPIDFPCMLNLDPQVVVDRFLALVQQNSTDVSPRRAPL